MARNKRKTCTDKYQFKAIRKAAKKRWREKKRLNLALQNTQLEAVQQEQPTKTRPESNVEPKAPNFGVSPREIPKPQAEKEDRAPILHKGVVKEISHNEVVKTEKWLGSGTFGSCYLAYYRGLVVAVKEFLVQPSTNERQIKEDVLYEAAVISRLGDHPGLPILFGITTQTAPYRLITQFHGEKNKSLIVWKAIRKLTLGQSCWFNVLKGISEALARIHEVGFLHNDLKSNNVLMERHGEAAYNPVIIDFGKARRIANPKPLKSLSPANQELYRKKYPHIAPEIVRGQGCQSVASDTYSLGNFCWRLWRYWGP